MGIIEIISRLTPNVISCVSILCRNYLIPYVITVLFWRLVRGNDGLIFPPIQCNPGMHELQNIIRPTYSLPSSAVKCFNGINMYMRVHQQSAMHYGKIMQAVIINWLWPRCHFLMLCFILLPIFFINDGKQNCCHSNVIVTFQIGRQVHDILHWNIFQLFEGRTKLYIGLIL